MGTRSKVAGASRQPLTECRSADTPRIEYSMAKYQAEEMMDAHNVAVGKETYFAESLGFCANDVIVIYDRNGVKWYEVKMKSATSGIITKQFVKIDNSEHKAAMTKAMESFG